MTREEAIEEIKSWDFLEGKEIEAIHTLIPELCENEDERIRRVIVKYFEELHEQSWINLEIPDILAWLEKQEIFSKNGEGCYYYHADGSYTFIGSMGFEPIEDMKLNGERPKTENKSVDLPGACLCVEKQKEQKPVEWGDDEMMRKRAIAILKRQRDFWSYDGSMDKFPPATPRKDLVNALDIAISYLEKHKLDASKLENFDPVDVLNRIKTEWPMAWKKVVGKQEWSEEDSDNLERVDNYLWMLDNYVGDDCATPQGKTDKIRGNIQEVLSPWLKNLPERFNLQPEQEWSEEDEHRRTDAIYFLESAKSHYADTSEIEETIRWLKDISLNHKKLNEAVEKLCSNEWSEEDEEMLQSIIKDFRAGKISTIGQEQWLKSIRPWKPNVENLYYDRANKEFYVKETINDPKSAIQELYKRLNKR